MKSFGKLAIISAAVVLFSATAMAQDSTTTTTRSDAPGGVFVGVPGVAGVQVGGPPGGCSTRTTTQTDNDTGASRSVTRSNC
jgi:hypothetical protein